MNYNEYSLKCREMVKNNDSFLLSQIGLSKEEQLRLNVNCNGYGRIRTFKRKKEIDWIDNPLPQEPFAKALSIDANEEIDVQVFEIAKCNLNCWWCFLPDECRTCDPKYTKLFTIEELVDLYLRDAPETRVIDLTGGNPEIVPEWILGFMKEFEKRNLQNKIYLWSDDVLTTNIMFDKLSKAQIDYMSSYRMYGKVACLKGFDEESFRFNACVSPDVFKNQLYIAKKYIKSGFDIFFYITLTCSNLDNILQRISNFFDELQKISYYLPLRIVPIKIKVFDNNANRILVGERKDSLDNQYVVLNVWQEELEKRFSKNELSQNIADIKLL